MAWPMYCKKQTRSSPTPRKRLTAWIRVAKSRARSSNAPSVRVATATTTTKHSRSCHYYYHPHFLFVCLPACLPARFRTQARRTKALRDDVAWMACPSKTRNKKKKKKRCGSPGRDESLCALQIIIATTSTLISRSRKEDTQGGWPDPATFTAQSCLLAERRERIKKSQQRWR